MRIAVGLDELAKALHLSPEGLQALRALSPKYTFHQKAKKSGGFRVIAVPVPELARIQRFLLAILREEIPISSRVYGGVRKRNYVMHALVHCRARSAYVVDLQDAFQHGTRERMRRVLASSFRDPSVVEAILDLTVDDTYGLPQGAPTSNAMFNMLCHELDDWMEGFARSMHWMFAHYTRYVDELVVSINRPIVHEERVAIKAGIEASGFHINPHKIRYFEARQGALQITGGSVHDQRVGLSKRKMDKLRAFFYRAVNDRSVTLEQIEGKMSQVRQMYSRVPRRIARFYGLARSAAAKERYQIDVLGWRR